MNLVPWRRKEVEERDAYALPFQDWVSYQSNWYNLAGYQTLTGSTESIAADFRSLITGAYQSNGIVFACMLTRQLHFCETRFQYRQFRNGRPGPLFGDQSLAILEKPWPNATSGDLLARMIQDVDLAGNFYAARQGDRLVRLRPDWTYIVLGSRTRRNDWEAGDPDTELVGYQYHPGGLHSGREPYLYFPEEVCHFAPIPDPLASYRGMSWLTPVIREIQADLSMTTHRQRFFDKGATVNMIVKIPVERDMDAFERWVAKLEAGHAGLANAYKTMYLGGGADATAVGSDMQQIDFKAVQGAGEVRIATAARIPPTILGISEGLQGSTLNAGNYASARRNLADGLLRPYWRMACGALANVVQAPNSGAELWYDEADVAFLKEDLKDAAEVRQADAATAKSLIDAGFEADAIIDAIVSDDFSRLIGNHTGLTSVQLQPPADSGDANTDTQPKPAVTGGTA